MPITSTTIGLSWCAATDNNCIDHYNVYNADGDVLLGTTDSTDWDYTVTGLLPLTEYTFYVIAYDCAGNASEPSNEITYSTLDGPAVEVPSDVTNFAFFNVTETTVNLSWDSATFPLGQGGYNIYYSDGITLFHQVIGINAYYDPTNLVGDTTYSLKVKAYSDLGVESLNFSNTITFTTDPVTNVVPTDVTNLVITDIGTTTMDLAWDAATFDNGVGGYYVYLDNGTLVRTTVGIGTTIVMGGLDLNTEYKFKVKAYDTLGYVSTNFSNTVTGTTLNILETTLNYATSASFIPGIHSDWTNPTNILSSGSLSSSTIPVGGESDRLYCNGFGFTIPGTATITGIEIQIYRSALYGSINSSVIQLMQSSSTYGNPRYENTVYSSLGELKIYGGSSDLWGLTPVPADLNSAFFGASIISGNSSTITDYAEIDEIRCKVYYTP